MKPLFIWAVFCRDIERQTDFTLSAFQEKDDAVAECLWQSKRAAKNEIYYVSMVRLYRPNENVLP